MMHRRRLIIVGQTPPPFNGQAKMIRLMIDGIQNEFHPVHIRMAYSDSVVSAGKFGFSKIRHLIMLIRKSRQALRKYPGAVLYYPPASPNLLPVLRDVIFLLAVRGRAAKTVLHFHSGGVSKFVQHRRWLSPAAMKAYSDADVAIELGPSCPHDGEFFRARKTWVVPNGLDVPVRQSLAPVLKAAPLRILYVGIHTETKGLFDLLATARKLKQRGVCFEIRTAGLWYTNEEQVRFERLRLQWRLEASVVTLGQKTGEDLWALYAWADVFFFPTFYPWETFGIVQVEAMAYGLPVVASCWQCPKDIVVNGETGFLCAEHDISAFAGVLEKLADNPVLRKRLGAAGQKRYKEKFTADCFINGLKRIFEEVCS